MTHDDLRAHKHSKQGDGGYVDFAAEINADPNADTIDSGKVDVTAFTEEATGTETITSNGSSTISTGITTENKQLLPVVGPTNTSSGLDGGMTWSTSAGAITNDSGSVAFAIQWNSSGGEWELIIDSGIGSETDFNWKIVSL